MTTIDDFESSVSAGLDEIKNSLDSVTLKLGAIADLVKQLQLGGLGPDQSAKAAEIITKISALKDEVAAISTNEDLIK